MIEAKLFVGQAEKVERAFNRWSADSAGLAIVSIMHFLRPEGEVGFMVLFQVAQQPPAPSKIVPVSGMVN